MHLLRNILVYVADIYSAAYLNIYVQMMGKKTNILIMSNVTFAQQPLWKRTINIRKKRCVFLGWISSEVYYINTK